MIVERVIEVRVARADPPRAERWISVTRAGDEVSAQPAESVTAPPPVGHQPAVAVPAAAPAVCARRGRPRRVAATEPAHAPAPRAPLTKPRPAPHLIRILLTPTEHALLERLHRFQLDNERMWGLRSETVVETARAAIACCADWPEEGAWLVQNAEYMARYRPDWEREAQTVPLAVELDERSGGALRRLAAEMDWLLEDAARFAIRNLYDAYDDQAGLAEPALPEAVPALALPVATATSAPPDEAPCPPTPAPAVQPVPAPSAPARRASPAPPPREEPPVARKRAETLERRPRHVSAEATPKPRVSHKDITAERELELIRRYQAGDRRAGDILLQAHEPIIYQEARPYFDKGLDVEDVMQAARMGFVRGIDKFDESRGFRLTTYALWWARQAARRELNDTGATIRIPVHVHDKLYAASQDESKLTEKLSMSRRLRRVDSLDAPVGDDGESSLGTLIASNDAGPEATLANEDAQARRRELIAMAMTRLTPQEQEIVRRRLLEEEPETLNEVGRSYGVCRERIRQIEVKALAKLERALRESLTDDDAVLWGAEPPS